MRAPGLKGTQIALDTLQCAHLSLKKVVQGSGRRSVPELETQNLRFSKVKWHREMAWGNHDPSWDEHEHELSLA